MAFKLKKNIISVKRDIQINLDKKKFIDLSRNERTTDLEKKLFKKIVNTISPYDLRKYPSAPWLKIIFSLLIFMNRESNP